MSTEQDGSSNTKPKFSKSTRVQIALAKFHGLGENGETWSIEKIADHLNVSEGSVRRYVYDSDLSDEVEEKLADAQARVRMRLAMKYLDRLDEIEDLIEERKAVKEPEVVSHQNVTVEGDVVMQRDGMSVGGENTETVEFQVPVPDHFQEVTDVSGELESLLREWRQTAESIENLLGLEAPEQIESEHREYSVEGRVFQGVDMSGFPEPDAELEGTEVELDDA